MGERIGFISLGWVLAFTLTLPSTSRAQAFDVDASCPTKMRDLVSALTSLLEANPNDVLVYQGAMERRLPIRGCNIDDVTNTSKQSKFFSGVYDAGWAYSISFQNEYFIVSFGVRKNDGEVILPAARVRLQRRIEQKT